MELDEERARNQHLMKQFLRLEESYENLKDEMNMIKESNNMQMSWPNSNKRADTDDELEAYHELRQSNRLLLAELQQLRRQNKEHLKTQKEKIEALRAQVDKQQEALNQIHQLTPEAQVGFGIQQEISRLTMELLEDLEYNERKLNNQLRICKENIQDYEDKSNFVHVSEAPRCSTGLNFTPMSCRTDTAEESGSSESAAIWNGFDNLPSCEYVTTIFESSL
ncbi:unconventional myosin-Vb-like [Anolis sagrei]|uniref:unconventional myosin-Vb-like n=1 Tax=Anolis sagrei TaxID=38937 RepID=UPI0035220E01